jgi:hypothetical protein
MRACRPAGCPPSCIIHSETGWPANSILGRHIFDVGQRRRPAVAHAERRRAARPGRHSCPHGPVRSASSPGPARGIRLIIRPSRALSNPSASRASGPPLNRLAQRWPSSSPSSSRRRQRLHDALEVIRARSSAHLSVCRAERAAGGRPATAAAVSRSLGPTSCQTARAAGWPQHPLEPPIHRRPPNRNAAAPTDLNSIFIS